MSPSTAVTESMTMASIGMQSLWELGAAFVNTMYGYQVYKIPEEYTCSRIGSGGQTMEPAFFLNMNVFTATKDKQHECEGSDWTSTYYVQSVVGCLCNYSSRL